MKILITGATGYIGHQLALTLAAQGNCVHIIVRNPISPNIPRHDNILVFTGDITDRPAIRAALAGCKQVYHTAAMVCLRAKDPSLFYKINVDGTNNLLAEALASGVKKFVFTSSCGVLGASVLEPKCENDPRTTSFDNDYEFTKFLAENLVREYVHKGLFTVIVSLSKVFGPGIETHPVSVNRLMNNFIKGRLTFIPKPASLVSNYSFINDIVTGHILAMENGIGGEKYILGGQNVSYDVLFRELRSLCGSKARVIQMPRFIATGLAWAQRARSFFTRKEPIINSKAIHHIFTNKAYNSEKAIRKLGYKPTPLKEALIQTIQFLKLQQHA